MKDLNLRLDLRVALLYTLFGAGWILLSDRLLDALALDLPTSAQLQTYKGTAFVALSGVFIFLVLRHELAQRRSAERRLDDSERLWQSVFAAAQDAILILNANYDCVAHNPAAEAMYGRSLTGLKLSDLRAPAARARILTDMEQARRESGAFWETVHQRADGSVFPVEVSTRPFSIHDGLYFVHIVRDITERKQAEEKLQSAALFSAENPNPILRLDATGTILYANPASQALLQAWESRVGARAPAVWQHKVAEALATQMSFTLEATYGEKTCSFSIIPIPEAGYVNAYGRDVTNQMKAEAYIRYQASLLNDVSDAIIATDPDFVILSWNKGAEALYGWTAQEVIGQPISKVIPTTYPSDNADAVLAQFRSKGYWRGEVIQKHKDGSARYVLADVAWTRDDDGNMTGAVAVNRDITERKRAEAAARLQLTALESTANAVVITDTTGAIQWVNPAYTQLTGYTFAEALGQNPRLLKSGHQPPNFYKTMWETITAGVVWHGEMVNKRKDGGFYTEEQTITPMRDATGQITHFIGIKQDITERQQAVLLATRRLAELETVNKVSTALRTAQTLDAMLPILLDETLAVFESEAGAILLYHPHEDELRFAVARGWFEPLKEFPLQPSEGIIGQVFTQGQPYVSREIISDPLIDLAASPSVPAGWGGACIPVHTGTDVVGVLLIAVRLPREVTSAEVKLLTSLADMAGTALHRLRLHDETERRLRQLQALRAIDQAISSTLDLEPTLNVVLEHTLAQLQVDAAGVLLLNPNSQTLDYAAGRGFGTRLYEQAHLHVGEGLAGQVAVEQRMVFATPIPNTINLVFAELVLTEQFVTYLGLPLISKGQLKGVLEVFHRTPLRLEAEWLEFLAALAGQTAIAVEDAQMLNHLQQTSLELLQAYDTTIEGWSRAMDLRDQETEGHSRRVTDLTLKLARAAGIPEKDLVHVRRGALLHDMGKLGVPDAILLKPGKLTEEEWAVMRQHPRLAYEMLEPIAYLRPALDIPFCHHEKWDGTGYPRGLKGEMIPLAARLFAVVDVWDALSSDRPYRSAWPREKTLEHIRSLAGSHFDPHAVELFFAVINETVPGNAQA